MTESTSTSGEELEAVGVYMLENVLRLRAKGSESGEFDSVTV